MGQRERVRDLERALEMRGVLRPQARQRRGGRTSALSSTVVTGISASGSISFTMDAGSASCVGAAGAGAAWTVGREAAMAAAMEGADAIVGILR
jgi:hypothetical protein